MSIFRARFRNSDVLLLILAGGLCFAAPARGQRSLTGAAEVELALHKLNTLGSVLMIAAHPDDENTALLAYYARGRAMRTGYLSLTRGEGGQNLIGSEQGDLLGVIRTQELLAARRIDGSEQFFTRAIDFGYSKTAEETLAKWGREKVLADIVWVIRKFRPDVIVLRFSGTPRDGHGHHQSSAILGKEAFSAAADAKQFPEQLRYVQPWQAKRLLFNIFNFSAQQEKEASETPGRVEVDTGEYNPVLGKSYTEIAGISRSMHRSQGMGAPERRGPSKNYLVTIAGVAADHDAFDGVDTTWQRLPGGAAVGEALAGAIAAFVPDHPEKIIPGLLKARPLLAALKDPQAARKLAELDELLALAAGLWADATCDRYAVTPGSSVRIEMQAINRSQFPVAWSGYGLAEGALSGQSAALPYNQPRKNTISWSVPPDAAYTQPFWLRKPRTGDLYDIADQQWIGPADNPPVLQAHFVFDFEGAKVALTRPVHYRYVDQTEGELTRSLVVVPPVAVNLPLRILLFPSEAPRKIAVQVKANVARATGELRLDLPPEWHADPPSRAFQLAEIGDEQDLNFTVTPPRSTGENHLRAVAKIDGREISSGETAIAYAHIPPQTLFPDAQAKLERAGVNLTARKVGYVMGAGDQVPEALAQLGCQVALLSARDLAEADLAGFDAIVTGVRAYNVRADLRANQQRLLDYVNAGGTMIVQYNVAEGGPFGGARSGELSRIGPYPLEVGRARVSVEEAPVRFLDEHHPLLTEPNPISARDFEGWVQERGLYFASEWDAHYQPVIESHDPGEKPQPGGMLYARYGKGIYIFSAYSWFRELPAGVPGAYRLFANMLSARAPR